MSNNSLKLTGTIYDKKMETIAGKKDPSQTYSKYLITLEVESAGERKRGDKEVYSKNIDLILFEAFNPSFDVDSFCIKDQVEIQFYIQGKPYEIKRGDRAGQQGLMNKNIITRVAFADIDTKNSNHRGKIKIDSMSDVNELPTLKTLIPDFPEAGDDPNGLDGLPF